MTDQVQEVKQDPLDNEVLKFEFTVSQTNAILQILGNAPYVASANLIQLIHAQGTAQFAELLKAEEPKAE